MELLMRWQPVTEIVTDYESVSFYPDTNALPETLPLIWRMTQDNYRISVQDTIGQIFLGQYQLFRRMREQSACYKRCITTPFVMVPIGPHRVMFWARRVDNGQLLRLYKTGVVIPSHMYKAGYTDACDRFEIGHSEGSHTWI